MAFLWQDVERLERTVVKLEKRVAALELDANPIRAWSIEFYTTIDGTRRRVNHMFLKVTDKLPLTISIKDRSGNPAKVDGIPAWAVTDTALATVVAAEDGMSAEVTPLGGIGAFKVQVTADADLGEGVKEILGELDIELLSAEAVTIEIAAGEAVPQ